MPTIELTEQQVRDTLSLICFELAYSIIHGLEPSGAKKRNFHRRLETLAAKLESL